MTRVVSSPRSLTQAWLALAGLLVAAPSFAATEIPVFRQGMWEYERSLGGRRYVAKECGDPSQDMRAHNASMERIGCKLAPVDQSGSTYTYTMQCAVKLPSGVATWSTTSTLTAEGEGGYRLEVHGTGRGQQDEVVVARRVADCNK